MAEDVIPSIAQRYHVSEEAAREVERALRANGGRLAQFSHADLGGPGQWMPGMVQVSRMADHQLRHRVEGLCAEIAAVVTGSETSNPSVLAHDARGPVAASRDDLPAGESWWPARFGKPATSGHQRGARYAWFPEHRSLLVQVGGRIDCYDTADHFITGVGQQQSGPVHGTSALTFTSQHGTVSLAKLKCVPIEPDPV